MEIELTKGLDYFPTDEEKNVIDELEKIDVEIRNLEQKMNDGKIDTLSHDDEAKYFELLDERKNAAKKLS